MIGELIDDAIAVMAPRSALRRKQARLAIRAYEAARPTRTHLAKRERRTADLASESGGMSLRQQARYMEENYDLARGVLNTLVNNVIGPSGITVEPQPRTMDGDIHEGLAKQIRELMDDMSLRPEVTWQHDEPSMQRILSRSWFRDGEVFAKQLTGNVRGLDHGTQIPHSLELLEADFVPYSANKTDPRITQGIEKNAWGRPVAYHVAREQPGSLSGGYAIRTKRIDADRMLHIRMCDRLHQTRGISVFASVLTRLADIKDYEESERVAARVAAAMTSYIRKGTPDQYEPSNASNATNAAGESIARAFQIGPGVVFDQLQVGEDVGVIDSSRPSGLLTDFRGAMIRTVAAGVSATYSSIARDYNGTYSAQRQELVEGYVGYGVLGAEFASQFVRPVYRSRLSVAITGRMLSVPADVDPDSLYDATYHSASMPWIDPDKEAKGLERLTRAGFDSEEDVIRARGKRPADVKAKIKRWREWANESDLTFSSDAANDRGANEGQQSAEETEI